MSGIKHDNNKPELSLIDPDFLEGLATVLTQGKEEYGAHNWRSGINFSRVISAAYRHIGAFNRGEDLDSKSGLPHVLHLAANAMFLHWYLNNRKGFDDRYRYTSSMSPVGGEWPKELNECGGQRNFIKKNNLFSSEE